MLVGKQGKERPAGLPEAVRSIAEARTGDAVFVVGPDHRIAYWDAEAETLTGVLAEEAVGRPCYEVVAGRREDCRFCEKGCSVMKLARAGRAIPSYEMRLSPRSGQGGWVGVSILSMEAGDGTYVVHLLRSTEKDHRTLEMARGLIEISRKGRAAPVEEPVGVPEITIRNRPKRGSSVVAR